MGGLLEIVKSLCSIGRGPKGPPRQPGDPECPVAATWPTPTAEEWPLGRVPTDDVPSTISPPPAPPSPEGELLERPRLVPPPPTPPFAASAGGAKS
mmetsp:Transcript_93470/g.207959  ORF Transcript_93470/g.207959 Transcript_93470/m.207959 type:complete len:96 (+) Transcript_93470:434-721(+)